MTAPIIHTAPTPQYTFRCEACGQIDLYETHVAKPVHCERAMALLKKVWVGGDKDHVKLALIHLDRAVTPLGFPVSDRAWPENWDPAYELWRFKYARLQGERIGWLGKMDLLEVWEWIMVPGVVPHTGAAVSKDKALSDMWDAINAG